MKQKQVKATKMLERATTYQEWIAAASKLDRIEGKDQWRQQKESNDYDYRLLGSRVRLLRKLRKQKDYDRLSIGRTNALFLATLP